jgi:hypothetical protein
MNKDVSGWENVKIYPVRPFITLINVTLTGL